DRIITLQNHSLCAPGDIPGVGYVGAVAISGTNLFAAANNDNDVVELDATKNGSQQPLARLHLPEGSSPWQAIDLTVGSN
ncbi:MAG: hypothetical protein JOY69_04885, partial [Candidatus Eremiobacteraeota bacterium]|nr:hypothetical protein [Candidatus Eremiobacteraeota bacterium]